MNYKYHKKYGVEFLSRRVIIGLMRNYAMYRELEKENQ